MYFTAAHVYGNTAPPERVERFIQHKALAEYCMILEIPTLVLYTSIRSALSDILYFLVIWLVEIFCSTQIATNFGDQDISNNLFLVVEQTNRIILASLLFTMLCT